MYTPKQALEKGLINEIVGNRFTSKKKATDKAYSKAIKLAKFYIDAGEPFVRLKKSLNEETSFDYQILIDNWFSSQTQEKIKKVVASLNKK